jgi:hypothetical protein
MIYNVKCKNVKCKNVKCKNLNGRSAVMVDLSDQHIQSFRVCNLEISFAITFVVKVKPIQKPVKKRKSYATESIASASTRRM